MLSFFRMLRKSVIVIFFFDLSKNNCFIFFKASSISLSSLSCGFGIGFFVFVYISPIRFESGPAKSPVVICSFILPLKLFKKPWPKSKAKSSFRKYPASALTADKNEFFITVRSCSSRQSNFSFLKNVLNILWASSLSCLYASTVSFKKLNTSFLFSIFNRETILSVLLIFCKSLSVIIAPFWVYSMFTSIRYLFFPLRFNKKHWKY